MIRDGLDKMMNSSTVDSILLELEGECKMNLKIEEAWRLSEEHYEERLASSQNPLRRKPWLTDIGRNHGQI